MEKASTTTTRSLEITIISAEGLLVRGRPVRKNAFVVVAPESGSDECLRSKVDNNGGSNPLWNDKLHVELPMHAPFIKAHVYIASSNGKDQSLIGTAVIPVTDFAAVDYLHRLSYRLKDRAGDRNGILNISVRSRATAKQPAAAASTTTSSYSYGSGCGYRSWLGRPLGDNNWVAIGIPVSTPSYPLI